MDKPSWTSTRLGPELENLSSAWLVPSRTSQAKLARLCLPSLVNLVNEIEWKPVIDLILAQQYHNEVVAEFPDVFNDKLPPRKAIRPAAPLHRIILKDDRKSING